MIHMLDKLLIHMPIRFTQDNINELTKVNQISIPMEPNTDISDKIIINLKFR